LERGGGIEMAQSEVIEGTSEELQRHLQQHPNERYRLIRIANSTLLEQTETVAKENEITPEEEERLLDELAALGKYLPASPHGETYSRETIYADHN
jgi:CRP-like cAMP-binding protein